MNRVVLNESIEIGQLLNDNCLALHVRLKIVFIISQGIPARASLDILQAGHQDKEITLQALAAFILRRLRLNLFLGAIEKCARRNDYNQGDN
ncbi:MAG: hypothetical protein A3J40_05440 [Erythrobacter sp. RIFCSPHIGHO2_12_FULL_63_10]|nr:MAG: hypothetical protein A3J40_05440 [Erythrobacter sp. RIFCSPHIGHO2_12_FULL_63_10]